VFSKSEGPDGEEEGGEEEAAGAAAADEEAAAEGGGGGGGGGGSEEGGGGGGRDAPAASPVAPHTERTRIPSAARGLVPPPLPPQVVPAHLVALQCAPAGQRCVATFLVGEAAVRLAAVREGGGDGGAEGRAGLAPLGALPLRGGALPLHLVCGDGGALLLGALAPPPAGGGAALPWRYQVRRLRCVPVGAGGSAWLADAGAGAGAPSLVEEEEEEGGGLAGGLSTLNAALAGAPLGEGGDHRVIAAAASLLTRLPIEFDKGTHPPPKKRGKRAAGAEAAGAAPAQ
jgi:hypothetical protein